MLTRAIAIQVRVVHALVMREILTRYGRHNIGFLWLFIEPMIFTLGVTALWTALKAVHGSSIPITVFALTGYSSVLLWRNMPARCIGAIGPNAALMFHRNVKAMDVFLSRILLEFFGATISFFTLALVFMGLEMIQPPEDILKVAAGWLLLAWFGGAFALFLGVIAERTHFIDKIWHPMSYLLFPLSGAAFLADALPTDMRDILLWLPMVHGVEFVRDGYFGSQFVAHYSVGYLLVANILLTMLGLSELRTLNKRMVVQ